MVSLKYKKAYCEVLELLKYLPKEEMLKIPKEKIKYFEENKDDSYEFKYDESKALQEQNISREANAIILTLFRDYFASDVQKEKLKQILNRNEKKYQEKLNEKYNPDNIFKNANTTVIETENSEQLPEIIKNETIFVKIINRIKDFLHINKNRI